MMEEGPGFIDDLDGIPDDTLLYRRIAWDMIGGRARVAPGEIAQLSGNCFRDYSEEKAQAMGYPGPCMSFAVGTVLAERRIAPEALLEQYPGYGLAVVEAGALRELTTGSGLSCPQGIMLAPTELEPWHGVVFDKTQRLRSDKACKAIKTAAEWHVPLVG
jgi:hypothetical protein